MSVDCRIVVGLTLEFPGEINWSRLEEFTHKHPELDEYKYRYDEREGKLLLIGDGMNGSFLRLVKVDKIIEELEDFDFVPLNMPSGVLSQELISQMSEFYKEYNGEYPKSTDFKYAMWSQWS
jgi:hypothetical protein